MTEQASTTKHHEYKEKISVLRKRTSEKVGRFASNLMFNAEISSMSRYTGVDLGEEVTDLMQEQYYQYQREKREYYKDKSIYLTRRLGAYATFIPGVSYARASIGEFQSERHSQKERRKAYKREHGTIVSKTKNNWEVGKEKLNGLSQTKDALAVRKESLNN